MTCLFVGWFLKLNFNSCFSTTQIIHRSDVLKLIRMLIAVTNAERELQLNVVTATLVIPSGL